MDYLQMLRMRNLFDPNQAGNDMPDQSGFGGNIPPLFQGSMENPDIGFQKRTSPFDNIQFGNTKMPAPGLPALGDEDNYDPGARMKEIYHPSHIASDKFDQMVGQYPQREQPSKMRRFAGAALGALSAIGDPTQGYSGGPPNHAMGSKVYNDITGKTRFDENVEDWKNQMGPLGQAANYERYNNSNERQNAYQTISAELRDHAQELKAKNDGRKADIAEKRAQIYEMKSNGYKFDFTGPTVIATRPGDPTPKDTGVPTGHMTQLDKLNLEAENRAANTTNKGEEDRKTERLRETGRESLADRKGWDVGIINDPNNPGQQISVRINKDTGEVKPIEMGGANTGPITKPGTPKSGGSTQNEQQKRIGEYNRATKLRNTNAKLREFIKLGPGANDFSITPQGRNWLGTPTGPNAEQMAEIARNIYGSAQPGGMAGTEMNLKPPVNGPNMGTEPLTAGSPAPNAGHPNEQQGQPQHVSQVPPEQRQAGHIYIMGNGQPGKWMGTHFEAVQ